MKKWNKPQLSSLSYRYTELGGNGGEPDGAIYEIYGFQLFGTSGDPLGDGFNRVN